jgi:hypothetical protein
VEDENDDSDSEDDGDEKSDRVTISVSKMYCVNNRMFGILYQFVS